jgi:4,5-dihydroxyphthalate decarboxylase
MTTSVYEVFLEAHAIGMKELPSLSALNVSLPWVEAEKLDTIALVGKRFWKYGFSENDLEIQALTRYFYEQRLAQRKITANDLLHKATFEISRI